MHLAELLISIIFPSQGEPPKPPSFGDSPEPVHGGQERSVVGGKNSELLGAELLLKVPWDATLGLQTAISENTSPNG